MKNQVLKEVQELLRDFNKMDKKEQGVIQLEDAVSLLKEKISINEVSNNLLGRVIFKTEKGVTFDEFLALLHQAELDMGIHNNGVNIKMLQFLKLLNEYRKKCELAGMYVEAENAYLKSLETQEKEMKRNQYKLASLQKVKVISINQLEQNKLQEFDLAWNIYMERYECAALNSLEKLKAKYVKELQIEEERIRNFYESTFKPSKRINDLKSKQKELAKQKMYFKAEKMKKGIQKLEAREREQKNQIINEKIRMRRQMVQKHQQASLVAYQKKIEKDKNDQFKKRALDLSRMCVKLQNINNNIVQRQSTEIKETLSELLLEMNESTGYLIGGRKNEVKSLEKMERSKSKQKICSVDVEGSHRKCKNEFRVRLKSYHSSTKGEDE